MLTPLRHIRCRLVQAVIAGGLVLLGGGTAVAQSSLGTPAASREGLFGSREIRSTDLTAFTKWTQMLARRMDGAGRAQPASVSGQCKPNPRFPCENEALDQLIDQLQDKDLAEQLSGVNLFMNRIRYVTDDVNWGVADYWATPQEFFQRDGDCEDFAIAKFAALERLGISADAMRIVILEDLNLDAHHAVLIVETPDGRMVLDNQVSEVIPDTLIHHYKPIYSINEHAWWLHIPAEGPAMLANNHSNN